MGFRMLVFDRSETSRYRNKPDIVASIPSAAIDKPLAKNTTAIFIIH
jgi:hypothetical protein